MNKYSDLKEQVKNMLLDFPFETYTKSGEALSVEGYETVEPRDFSEEFDKDDDAYYQFLCTKRIGSSNFFYCLDIIIQYTSQYINEDEYEEEELAAAHRKVFHQIFSELIEEGVIKETPELKRSKFELIDNTKKEEKNEEM